MRRVIMLTALTGFVLLGGTPAGADPIEKSTYIVAECAIERDPQSIEEMRFPSEDSIQIRQATNLYDEYLDVGCEWIGPFARNTTVANVTATFPSSAGTYWGTWAFDGYGQVAGFDDMEGTWVFTENGAAKATGKTEDGCVVKVALDVEPPAPPSDDCGVAEFVIYDR